MVLAHRIAGLLAFACLAGWPALCGGAGDPASEGLPGARRPFVSLLLPLASPVFARAAQAVADGCASALAASSEPLALEISRTDASPASISASYQSAASRGAAVIVGPLTRDGVTALARTGLPGPPTLTLNVPEPDTPMPERFFTFGLSAEAEARTAAHHAYAAGLRDAVVVDTGPALSRRVARAFASEWVLLGGKVTEALSIGSPLELTERAANADADLVFLAADAAAARATRPYLNPALPVYAVSLVHEGAQDALSAVDLNGIHFVDMPWLVQPDHPAVMIYPRPDTTSLERQRFYALGIDACRLAPLVAARRTSVQLDGVTGHLRLAQGTIEREPVAATFQNGLAVAAGAVETPR
jgi:outer membrane PBP1 activator LpoA protein